MSENKNERKDLTPLPPTPKSSSSDFLIPFHRLRSTPGLWTYFDGRALSTWLRQSTSTTADRSRWMLMLDAGCKSPGVNRLSAPPTPDCITTPKPSNISAASPYCHYILDPLLPHQRSLGFTSLHLTLHIHGVRRSTVFGTTPKFLNIIYHFLGH